MSISKRLGPSTGSKIPRMRIVFQGDSVTDFLRDRANPNSLGDGYVSLVAKDLPEEWTLINRGISGNRVYDLEARWQEDCLDLAPDLVTILIGINDTWRRYDSNLESPIPEFEACLQRISQQAVDAGAKLILLEPFLLPIPEDRIRWREDLDPRLQAVRRVARTYASALIPLDGLFNAATCHTAMHELAYDGVHPGPAGNRLIAEKLVSVILRVTQPY